MKFISPSTDILNILNPDAFVAWQKASNFVNVHIWPTYDMQVKDQCNFATMWGLYKLRLEGRKGFFAWGEFDQEQHSWIIFDGLYYDLTLNQFHPLWPKLAITKPNNKRYKTVEVIHVDQIPLSFDKWKQGAWLEKAFSKYCEPHKEM